MDLSPSPPAPAAKDSLLSFVFSPFASKKAKFSRKGVTRTFGEVLPAGRMWERISGPFSVGAKGSYGRVFALDSSSQSVLGGRRRNTAREKNRFREKEFYFPRGERQIDQRRFGGLSADPRVITLLTFTCPRSGFFISFFLSFHFGWQS